MNPRVVAALALLAALPYLRAFTLPFISDDYLLLHASQRWGPVSGWSALAQDALYRCRAASVVFTYWLREAAGIWLPAYYAATVGLHGLNTLLVASLGAWSRIGYRISVPAAAWFALHEIKQEAVLWYSAVPELLVFAFLAAGLLLFRRWLESGRARWYAAALACYLLALLSKESAVVFGPLCAVFLWLEGRLREKWISLTPFLLLAVVYSLPIFAAKATHLHLNDGTFVLGPHFALVVTLSSGRLLWFWGALALLYLLLSGRPGSGLPRPPVSWRPVLAGAAWTLLCLLPYSFLTYMPRIPSRHNYLASAGVALIGGAAWLLLRQQRPRWAWTLAAVFLLHNTLYVSIFKHPAFVRRAQPTERLLAWVEANPGPFWVRSFPFNPEVTRLAVAVRLPHRLPDFRFGTAPPGQISLDVDEAGQVRATRHAP